MKQLIIIALLGAFDLNASKAPSYAGKPLPEAPQKTVAARQLPPVLKVPKISSELLIEAIENPGDHNQAIVRSQLVAYPELINVVDANNNNLLMIALSQESEVDDDFVFFLLGKTKNLEHRNKHGETALMKAASYPHHQVLAALLRRGAIADVVDNEGTTSLMAAAASEDRENTDLLVQVGVPIDLKIILEAPFQHYSLASMSKIVKKVVEDIESGKLLVATIDAQWQKALGRLHPMLGKLFGVSAQEIQREIPASHKVADKVVFIYLDHTELPKGIISQELAKAIDSGGMIIIATTHAVLNALPSAKDTKLFSQNWDMRLADESGQIVVLFPRSDGKSFNIFEYGMQRDHMKRISVDQLGETYKKHGPGKYPDQYLIPALSKIFVIKNEYAQHRLTQLMPRFAVYVAGHGALNRGISGLGIEHFKGLLNFLKTKVRTVLLIYGSCFAMGSNANELFKDWRAALAGTTYPFPIVTNGAIDSYTYGVVSKLDYKFVVSQLTQVATLDLAKILPALLGDITARQPAWVRFADTSWFVPFDAIAKSISIGKTLVSGRTEPLRVQDELLLLYDDIIPFDIKLTLADRYPQFLSMLPGAVVHYFLAVDIGPNDFLPFMQYVVQHRPERYVLFWIKRLRSNKLQRGIFKDVQELEDVIFMFSDDHGFSIVFTKNNESFDLEGDRITPIAEDYRSGFEKIFLQLNGQPLSERLADIASQQKQTQDILRVLRQRKDKAARAALLPQKVLSESKAPDLLPKPVAPKGVSPQGGVVSYMTEANAKAESD